MIFEWDENKNKINKRKHGISFEEAKTVFNDLHAILFSDPDHSDHEERFLMLGMSNLRGICIVSHCYRQNDDVIRIISARKADREETEIYTEGI